MAHIIVVGNEKGGSGKSTTSMHVATALARMGHRVGGLDLDVRQRSFGRYLENRAAFLVRKGLDLPMPVLAPLGEGADPLTPALRQLEETCDFILLDCPGSHTKLSQMAHTVADTLITPLNDSFACRPTVTCLVPRSMPRWCGAHASCARRPGQGPSTGWC